MNRSLRLFLIVTAMAALAIVSILISACASNAQPTPTPTRTPRPAGATPAATAPPAVVVPSPTHTPAPTNTRAASPTVPPTPSAVPSATATATPPARAANANPLTGLPVSDPKVLVRRPLFVAVGNDPEARAVHYGFTEADLVYEYIMEGRAVTRFTLAFLANESERIGPLRSGRLVNFHLTPQYGGALAVSGAQGQINWFLTFKMAAPYLNVDLDDPSQVKYAYNIWGLAPSKDLEYLTRLWTSTDRLRRWLSDKKAEQDPKLVGFTFSETAPAGAPAKSASIPFPAAVTWTYDPTSGRYLRSMGGAAHKDGASGKQLSAANVIIQTVAHEKTEYWEDAISTSIRIVTVGEGPVTILRDGVAIKGTWRAGDTTMPEFFDPAGKPIALKPGNSWFELVAPETAVTIQ